MWICLAITRTTYDRSFGRDDQERNLDLLFAPSQLVVQAFRSPVVVCIWRGSSHLRPSTRAQLRRQAALPSCYWLLLLSGDIEVNPGPSRYPCTSCCKPVRSNQQGIFCNRCELWTHARCCGVSKEAYDKLSREGENCQWWCPQCLSSELPFADSSMSTDHPLIPDTSLYVLDQSMDASTLSILSPENYTYAHLNTQSLIPKWEEVQDFLKRAPCPLILGLSETWLDNSVADAAISVSTYNSYRRDRQGRRGGGILVYVPETVRSWRRSDLELDTVEAIWIEIHIGRSSALVCNIYRPPDSQPAFFDNLEDMLELASGECKDIIIMGDMNSDILSPNSATNQLLSIMADHQLTQLITDPTRVTPNSQTLIDHCYVSSSVPVASSGTAPLAGSDHQMIYTNLPLSRAERAAPKVKEIRSFKKCNLNSLSNDLVEAPWGTMDVFDAIDEKWGYWKTVP